MKRHKATIAWLLIAVALALATSWLPLNPVHIYGLRRASLIANPFETPLWGQAGVQSQKVSARGTPLLVQISNPAAGADWTWLIGPASTNPQAYLFHFAYAILTTSATAANRAVRIGAQFTSGGVTVGIWPTQALQTASLTQAYSISHAASSNADSSTNFVLMPYDIWMAPGMQLISSTLNIQAGDQWSSINIYTEQFPSANY
jgi:hypothetical protein